MTEAFVVMCITVLLAFAAGVALGIALQLPKDWTDRGGESFLWVDHDPEPDPVIVYTEEER